MIASASAAAFRLQGGELLVVLGIQSGGLWQNTVPVFAVLISLLLFGVQPLAEQLIGGAVVLAGVRNMQWQRLRSRPGA